MRPCPGPSKHANEKEERKIKERTNERKKERKKKGNHGTADPDPDLLPDL
jgi:hypothetical protein